VDPAYVLMIIFLGLGIIGFLIAYHNRTVTRPSIRETERQIAELYEKELREALAKQTTQPRPRRSR
jgi:hypothetical protein